MLPLEHASAVALEGRAVLLRGPSGVGKSSLALQLIERGARLVADDQTKIYAEGGRLFVAPPEKIAGLLEVRGVGLLRLPYESGVPLALVVDLEEEGATLERLPEKEFILLLDHPVPWLRLAGKDPVTPAKIRAALFYETVTDEL